MTEHGVRAALGSGRVRVGLGLIGAVVLVALLGPLLSPHGATDFVGRPNSLGIDGAPFGTDYLGQDVWSRFLLGGRAIIAAAFAATALGVAAGAAVGVLAAARRGVVDEVAMRAVDVALALPQLLFVLIAMTTIGAEPWLVVAVVAASTAPRVARVVHGAATAVAGQEFVRASEAAGDSSWRIAGADLLPNVTGPLMVEVGIRFAYAIGLIASLAFLGFTPHANAANWGVMVQENRAALGVQPWGVVLPAVAIVTLALGASLVADGFARVSARLGGRRHD